MILAVSFSFFNIAGQNHDLLQQLVQGLCVIVRGLADADWLSVISIN